MFLDIELTQSLTHSTVYSRSDAFPTGAVSLTATKELAVEIEVGIDKVVAKIASGRVDFMPSKVSLHDFDISFGNNLAKVFEILRLSDVETLHALVDLHIGKVALPVDVLGQFRSLLNSVAVESAVGVTVFEASVLALSQTSLKGHNKVSELVSGNARHFVVASKSELFGHKFDITLADVFVVALIGGVVIAVAKTEATLVSPSDAHLSVVFVSLTEDTKKDMVATMVHFEDLVPDILAGFEVVDFLKIRSQRSHALLLELDAVHTKIVESSDFVGHRALRVFDFAHRVDDSAEVSLSLLTKDVESSIAAVLSIKRIVSHPTTTSVLVEIVYRTSSGVQVIKVNTRGQIGLFVTTSCN